MCSNVFWLLLIMSICTNIYNIFIRKLCNFYAKLSKSLNDFKRDSKKYDILSSINSDSNFNL